jgi:hypothetical protein
MKRKTYQLLLMLGASFFGTIAILSLRFTDDIFLIGTNSMATIFFGLRVITISENAGGKIQ